MEAQFKKTSGICLLIGSALATLTMVLHPLGGNLAEIARTKNIFVFSHSLAILCIPYISFGFWGLSHSLVTKGKLSFLAFTIMCFGLVAVMIAGTFDGLILPHFAAAYFNSDVNASVLQAIRDYGRFINLSMDYIFIGATVLSISIWSYLIITGSALPKWLGYYGILLVTSIAACLFLELNFTSVWGFSVFVFGIVSWMILAAIQLIVTAKKVQL